MAIHVIDTHALIWHFTQDPSLSARVRSILLMADQGAEGILVPSIVLVEFIYLAERKKISEDLIGRIVDLTGDPSAGYRPVSLDLEIARKMQSVDRAAVPDLPDRVIAATALAYRLPVLTKDSRLRAFSGIQTVW